MNDSADAKRMRRVRAHKRGDHDLCTPKHCDVAMAAAAAALGAPAQPAASAQAPATAIKARDGAGDIESAVTAFVAALPYREPDPRALLAQIAVKLAQRVDDTGAVPAAVRELRVMLMQLTEVPNAQAGPVDETRLRAAQKKLDIFLAQSGTPA